MSKGETALLITHHLLCGSQPFLLQPFFICFALFVRNRYHSFFIDTGKCFVSYLCPCKTCAFHTDITEIAAVIKCLLPNLLHIFSDRDPGKLFVIGKCLWRNRGHFVFHSSDGDCIRHFNVLFAFFGVFLICHCRFFPPSFVT